MMDKIYISKYDESVKKMCENDSEMQKLVSAVGDIEVSMRTDYLASLVRSIVGQQISVAAASAIYERLKLLVDHHITADALHEKTREELREAGLTRRKVDYVKDLAQKVSTREIDLAGLTALNDKSVIRQLTSVKGIGKWTAEMFLMLSLGRKDILAIDDVGLQRAAMWLYKTEKAERRSILIKKADIWRPYRSIASFYLWEAVHLNLITDYATIEDAVEKDV